MVRHDIESSSFAPNLLPPLLRRRRGWLALLLLVVLPLSLLTLVYTSPPARERMLDSVQWVKDNVHPSVAPLAAVPEAVIKQPLAVPLPQSPQPQQQAPQPLDKLTKLVLFVARLTRDGSFKVPNDRKQRQKVLDPDLDVTASWLEQGSSKVLDPDLDVTASWLEQGSSKEATQFEASPHAWAESHLPPLIVFSKTYCPYSKRAKALLASLGAHPLIIEVDLRNDDAAVKAAMAELTSHSTFPTVLLSGKLLGGSDDLVKYNAAGILAGMLNGAGALKAPA